MVANVLQIYSHLNLFAGNFDLLRVISKYLDFATFSELAIYKILSHILWKKDKHLFSLLRNYSQIYTEHKIACRCLVVKTLGKVPHGRPRHN